MRTKLLFLSLLLWLAAIPARGAEPPVWIEAAGESRMGELDTPQEVKARARREAQNRAVEQGVGTFIKSHTLVTNNQLADDLLYAAVRGTIEKSEVIAEGWDERDRDLYRVRLRALVSPIYPERGQGLALKVGLSKSELKEGEAARIAYQASSDCHIYIFSVAADGSVTLLFPNSRERDNKIVANQGYEFPPAGSPLKLEALFLPGFTGDFAEEHLKIIATRNPEPIIPLGFQEGMFQAYDGKSTGMINDLVKKLNQLEPADWSEATVTYRIVR